MLSNGMLIGFRRFCWPWKVEELRRRLAEAATLEDLEGIVRYTLITDHPHDVRDKVDADAAGTGDGGEEGGMLPFTFEPDGGDVDAADGPTVGCAEGDGTASAAEAAVITREGDAVAEEPRLAPST